MQRSSNDPSHQEAANAPAAEPPDGERRALTLGAGESAARLDRALAAHWPDLSRTRLKALILDGRVTVNASPVRDPAHHVRAGEAITIEVPPATPAEPEGEAIPLAIVFEDDDIIVIDKPKGLVVHPAAGHDSGTLVNALIAHCGASLSGIGGVKRPGIVHRLDKDTTGLMVAAKNDRAHASLSAQFADHGRTGAMERGYLAFVWGAPARAHGTIEAPIDRNPHNREKMAVRAGGREAVTHWQVLETYAGRDDKPIASLLACRLETGRTHQIRVHLAHAGHPLLGDDVYGAGFKTKAAQVGPRARTTLAALGRQALHAYLLVLEHPASGEILRWESPLPEDLLLLQAALRSRDWLGCVEKTHGYRYLTCVTSS